MYTTQPRMPNRAVLTDLVEAKHKVHVVLSSVLFRIPEPSNGTCGVLVGTGETVSVEIRDGLVTKVTPDVPAGWRKVRS